MVVRLKTKVKWYIPRRLGPDIYRYGGRRNELKVIGYDDSVVFMFR